MDLARPTPQVGGTLVNGAIGSERLPISDGFFRNLLTPIALSSLHLATRQPCLKARFAEKRRKDPNEVLPSGGIYPVEGGSKPAPSAPAQGPTTRKRFSVERVTGTRLVARGDTV